jgi:spermidine synthase
MAGLGVGAIVIGRIADRLGNPLFWYGLAEVAIGAWAVLFPVLCAGLRRSHDALLPALQGNPLGLRAVAFGGALVLLVPPTFLMGGTFPLLVRGYLQARASVERSVRDLYLFNTAGAVAGTTVAGFVLVRVLGLLAATELTALASFAIGGVALWLARRATPRTGKAATEWAEPTDSSREAPLCSSAEKTLHVRGIALAAVALSGLAALSFETLWTRVLLFVIGTTTLCFAVMLSSFLSGLALGAWLLRFLGNRHLVLKAGLVQAGIALSAVATLFALQALADVAPRWRMAAGAAGVFGRMGFRYAMALVILLPTATLIGMAFPLLMRVCVRERERAGAQTGWAYGSNTLGAILGPPIAMLALIPLWGIGGGVVATAALNLMLAAVLLGFAPEGRLWIRAAAVGPVVAAFLILSHEAPTSVAFCRRTVLASEGESKMLYFKEAPEATVGVFEIHNGLAKVLSIDGIDQVPTDADSMEAFALLGHLPFLVSDNARDVLVTAFGGGISLGAILCHPVERVEAVEICPAVMPAAGIFRAENRGAFEDPRLHVTFADAASYVRAIRKSYDVIVSDSTHPTAAESWVLYTRDFYADCKARLRSGGIMCQWVPLHQLPTEDLRTVLRTFQSVFPHTSLWFARGHTVMLGTPEPLRLDGDRVVRNLLDRQIGPSLTLGGINSPACLRKNMALDEDAVARFARGAPIATKNRSPLEWTDVRRGAGSTVGPNCQAIADAVGQPVPMDGVPPEQQAELDRAVAVRADYYRVIGLWSDGQFREAMRLTGQIADALPNDGDLALLASAMTTICVQQATSESTAAGLLDTLRVLGRALPLEPEVQVRVGRALATIAKRTGDDRLLQEGLVVLKSSADRFQDDPGVQFVAAKELIEAGRPAEARRYLERTLILQPDDPAARQLRDQIGRR